MHFNLKGAQRLVFTGTSWKQPVAGGGGLFSKLDMFFFPKSRATHVGASA